MNTGRIRGRRGGEGENEWTDGREEGEEERKALRFGAEKADQTAKEIRKFRGWKWSCGKGKRFGAETRMRMLKLR